MKDRENGTRPSPNSKRTGLYQNVKDLPGALWAELAGANPDAVAHRAGAVYRDGEGYILRFLDGEYLISVSSRSVVPLEGAWPPDFQAGLVMLNYLIHAAEDGLTGRMVTSQEIKGGNFFFKGPHELKTVPIIERFGRDGDGLLARAETLGAVPLQSGDASFRLLALPKVLLAYILYEEDEEFPARLTITFDASVASHLPLDSIFALVNVVADRLAPDEKLEPEEIFGTGACGINCLTCRLSVTGVCSPCGAGASLQASKKLGAQLHTFGGFCPILKCASDRKLGFCTRDCDLFPCEHFTGGPYPFSKEYLDMQVRRRKAPGPPQKG